MAKTEANAKVNADMDKAQASFMEARAEKRKAEEKKENIFSKLRADKQK